MSVAVIFDNVGLTGQLDMRIHQEASEIYHTYTKKKSKSRLSDTFFLRFFVISELKKLASSKAISIISKGGVRKIKMEI